MTIILFNENDCDLFHFLTNVTPSTPPLGSIAKVVISDGKLDRLGAHARRKSGDSSNVQCTWYMVR
mgnify:CR=1 FL=1